MSADIALAAVVIVPLCATVASIFVAERVASLVTVVAGLTSFALTVVLIPAVENGPVATGFLRVDALSVVFMLPSTFLYGCCAIYSVGYLQAHDGSDGQRHDRYARWFYIGLNAFAWSMICAPAMDGLAMLWIAIEVTTVISALLVAIDATDGATEAAWKYVLLASTGLGIALLATVAMYYAGSQRLGESYDLSFGPLLAHASELPPTPVRLAFALAVVGFGTKVGLVPMHTWLPDAHAEAPTPVSALLSGSLLSVSAYAILRYYQVAVGAVGTAFPRTLLLVFGGLSLLLGAVYLFEQFDVKRMLAYSSVEHMGIVAVGVSFGTRLACAGALLHVLAHAAAKGNAFMGAGVLVRKYGTKQLEGMRDAVGLLPWSGPLFALSVLALSAMPPFGVFRSEFEIVAGGIGSAHGAVASAVVVVVALAFLGLMSAATRVLFEPWCPSSTADRRSAGGDHEAAAELSLVTSPKRAGVVARPKVNEAVPVKGEPSAWMVVPVVVGVIALVVLGVHPPDELRQLLDNGSAQLVGQQ